MTTTAENNEVNALVSTIRPLLTGHAAPVQGTVLADLLAMWLADHSVPGDADETLKIRTQLLVQHLFIVRRLTELYAPLDELKKG